MDKTFRGFSRGLGLWRRIICLWRLKALRTSSWGGAQHLSSRGAEGMPLYLSMAVEGLRNLWMQEEEGDGFQPGQGWVPCPGRCWLLVLAAGEGRLQREVPEREGDL